MQDFKVRMLNSRGTASRTRVSLDSTDGVNNNIIQSSLRALVASVDYLFTTYVSAEEIKAATQKGIDAYSFFSDSSRYFSSFLFTLCKALSIDFTCLPRDSAISW